MTERAFRQRHPVLFGLFVLGCLTTVLWGGIALLVARLAGRPDPALFPSGEEGIGVIDLSGVIVSADETIADLTEFRNDPNVKAIVLRIDSPGGAVGASQELYSEVRRTNAVKPVVASMGSVAASGGYYAALGARKIVANPGTLTGSIGVIIKFANLETILGKIGYKDEVIKSGALKDIGAMNRAMTDEERALVQDLIDGVHRQFIEAVSESRDLPTETVTPLADGRVMTGEQAKQLGLLDELGNLTDAVRRAAELGGIDPENPELIYPRKKEFSLMDLVADERAGMSLKRLLPGAPGLSYEWSMPRGL